MSLSLPRLTLAVAIGSLASGTAAADVNGPNLTVGTTPASVVIKRYSQDPPAVAAGTYSYQANWRQYAASWSGSQTSYGVGADTTVDTNTCLNATYTVVIDGQTFASTVACNAPAAGSFKPSKSTVDQYVAKCRGGGYGSAASSTEYPAVKIAFVFKLSSLQYKDNVLSNTEVTTSTTSVGQASLVALGSVPVTVTCNNTTSCPTGQKPSKPGACQSICRASQYYDPADHQCKSCDYKSVPNAVGTACTRCPSGQFVGTPQGPGGSSSLPNKCVPINDCGPGAFHQRSYPSNCQPCPEGQVASGMFTCAFTAGGAKNAAWLKRCVKVGMLPDPADSSGSKCKKCPGKAKPDASGGFPGACSSTPTHPGGPCTPEMKKKGVCAPT